MQKILKNHGTNDLVDSLLKGELTLDDAVDELIQAWISVLQQIASKSTVPQSPQGISVEDYQSAYTTV